MHSQACLSWPWEHDALLLPPVTPTASHAAVVLLQASKVSRTLVDSLNSLPRQPAAARGLDTQGLPQPPFPDLPELAPALPDKPYYGLNDKHPAWTPELASQVDAYRRFQLGKSCLVRPGKAVKRKTASKEHCTLVCLLGYVHDSLQLPGQLTLATCLQPDLVALFITAKIQAGQNYGTVLKVPRDMLKVRAALPV